MGRIVGLLGGVASGKSSVAERMAASGWVHLDADAEARRAIEDPELKAALAGRFGADLFDEQGRLDRSLLARRAFADRAATQDLNAIVHPSVRSALLAGLEAAGERPVVLDVPLLLNSPLAGRVDTWVFVDADEAAREARAHSRGWPPGERQRRDALQPDLAVKRARADLVLENSGTIDDLDQRVHALLKALGTPLTPRERRDAAR